ncbi:hypothetical protein [Snodgrassella communis]|uniref:hypothetical protein n=1 Tax=Snodgrassella communis TaxID=2946699 RepID=UPI001EF3ED76|nr:hypothetical protein [Snodgrassella communis]
MEIVVPTVDVPLNASPKKAYLKEQYSLSCAVIGFNLKSYELFVIVASIIYPLIN